MIPLAWGVSQSLDQETPKTTLQSQYHIWRLQWKHTANQIEGSAGVSSPNFGHRNNSETNGNVWAEMWKLKCLWWKCLTTEAWIMSSQEAADITSWPTDTKIQDKFVKPLVQHLQHFKSWSPVMFVSARWALSSKENHIPVQQHKHHCNYSWVPVSASWSEFNI